MAPDQIEEIIYEYLTSKTAVSIPRDLPKAIAFYLHIVNRTYYSEQRAARRLAKGLIANLRTHSFGTKEE